MSSGSRVCWVSERAQATLAKEALQWYPLETGGLLIGYTDPASAPVVTDVIGPGPAAVHAREGFVPDYGDQEKRLAELYHGSARTLTYLGDWHTHPNGAGAPSHRDRRVLRRIARAKSARLQRPLMGIVTIEDDRKANLAVWQYVPDPWTGWFGRVEQRAVLSHAN